jgi:D-3-phosphoglycerate dehydrogenase
MALMNVVRFDRWIDPVFDQRLAQEKDIDLEVAARQGADEAAWAALAAAHVYQITAAKDELPRHFFASDALLARCPQLLCVSSTGAGFDTVDAEACTRAGVAVVNQAGANADSVAEHAMGLLLAVIRRIVETDRRMHTEIGYAREDLMGHEIRGRTIGIVGLGHTGRRVAALARAFGMQVLATDPNLSEAEMAARGARKVELGALLAVADVLSLHCPRDAGTLKMIDAAALAKMKRGAILVSTARGGIHDEQAVYEALRSGQLSGAGLDVWEVEPPPLDHPLLGLTNVIATFHLAGVTHEARRNVASMAADQIAGLLHGRRPPRIVNPAVWPAFAARYKKTYGKDLA